MMTMGYQAVALLMAGFDDAIDDLARERGRDSGDAAGSWIIDGNTTDATCARLLAGIEDGDPEVLDQLPYADLSGQWADSPTADSITADIFDTLGIDRDEQGSPENEGDLRADDCYVWTVDAVADAYRDAFDDAVNETVYADACSRLGVRPGPDLGTWTVEVTVIRPGDEVSADERTFTTDELREHFAASERVG